MAWVRCRIRSAHAKHHGRALGFLALDRNEPHRQTQVHRLKTIPWIVFSLREQLEPSQIASASAALFF
jgi:hypothetical protein